MCNLSKKLLLFQFCHIKLLPSGPYTPVYTFRLRLKIPLLCACTYTRNALPHRGPRMGGVSAADRHILSKNQGQNTLKHWFYYVL